MRDGGPGALGRRRSAEWKSREMTMPGNDKAGGAGRDDLTIRDVRARMVEVPMRFAMGTSAEVVRVAPLLLVDLPTRSEERRVGKECVRPCSSRWSASHSKKQ